MLAQDKRFPLGLVTSESGGTRGVAWRPGGRRLPRSSQAGSNE